MRAKRLIPLLYLTSILPAAALILIVHVYSVNAFRWDDWGTLLLIQKMQMHTLTFQDVWRQHNEHRMLFPNVLFLLTDILFRWNNVTLTYESIAFAAVAFAFLIGIIRQSIETPLARAVITTISSLIFFSVVQYFNWLIGFDLQWFTLLAGICGCIYLLTGRSRSWGNLIAAAAFATLATYSLANGLTLWWIVLIVMLLDRNQWTAKQMSIWSALGLTVCILFFIGWQPLWQADPHYWLRHPGVFLQYVLTFLGNIFGGGSVPLSMILGFSGLSLLTFVVYTFFAMRRSIGLSLWPNGSPWLMLSLVSLSSAITCATARCAFGLPQALSSRYVSIGDLFWIGLLGLTFWLCNEVHKANYETDLFRVPVTLGGYLAVLLIVFLSAEISSFQELQDLSLTSGRAFIGENNFTITPSTVRMSIYPSSDELDSFLSIAKTYQEGPFSDQDDCIASQDYVRASIMVDHKQYDDAIPQLEFSARHLNFGFIHYKLGYCYYQVNRLADANREFTLAKHLNGRYRYMKYGSKTSVTPEWNLPTD